jgi:hypothetical protein
MLSLNGRDWDSTAFILAAGEPRVIQVQLNSDTGPVYTFLAARPDRFDQQKRIVEIATWPVQCGPPPPGGPCSLKPAAEAAESAAPANDVLGSRGPTPPREESETAPPKKSCVTLDPLPGMNVADQDCRATDAAAVRNAARLSEKWDPVHQGYRWIRDSFP